MGIYGTSIFKNGCESEISQSICEHLETVHKIKREDVLSTVIDMLSNNNCDDDFDKGSVKDNIISDNYKLGLYLCNTDINIEKIWNEYQNKKVSDIGQLKIEKETLLKDISMRKAKFLIEIEGLSNSVKILDKVIIMKNNKLLKTGKTGFTDPVPITDELAIFLGKEPGTWMARTEVTRELDKYFKKHNLQNPDNRRNIFPNKEVKKLLRLKDGDKLSYFNLQKYISPHLLHKRKKKNVSTPVSSGSQTVSPLPTRVEKKTGFTAPALISDELAIFLGKEPGTWMARTEVTKELSEYFKKHNLQNPDNLRIIFPNEALKKLLKIKPGDELSYFNLQRYISPHFPKKKQLTN